MSRHFGSRLPGHSASVRQRAILTVCCMVLFGCTLAFSFLYFSTSTEASQPTLQVKEEPSIKMREVLIPIREIAPATPLHVSMFRMEARPAIGVEKGALRSFEEVRGYYARTVLIPNMPVYQVYLTNTIPGNELTPQIPKGFRGIAIRVDERSSVVGFAEARTKVDVLWSSKVRGVPGVRVIVENALVLSAARNTSPRRNENTPIPNTVTLLATQKDAALIELAAQTGTLSLLLRGDDNEGKGGEVVMVTLADLTGSRLHEPQKAVRPAVIMDGSKWYLNLRGELVPMNNL